MGRTDRACLRVALVAALSAAASVSACSDQVAFEARRQALLCSEQQPTVLDPPEGDVPDDAHNDESSIPVGYDAFRYWDRWPLVRLGTRTIMRSTYDRSGGNERSDAGHFLRRDGPSFYVPLDVAGPGALVFVRTNRWHGSPWHYLVDCVDRVVEEASTPPRAPAPSSFFIPTDLFPRPFAWTWTDTHGSDLSWVPMTFARSLTLGYSRTHYGTGYFIVQLFPERAENVSRPIRAREWAAPPADVMDLIGRAGEDVAPQGSGVATEEGSIDIPATTKVQVARIASGPRVVRALRFTVPRDAVIPFGRTRLRITWDDRSKPSIDVPLALFFGAGTLYNRENREFLVKSFPSVIRFDAESVELSTYFPMPFAHTARIELVGASEDVRGVQWHVRTVPATRPIGVDAYFHATYRDHGEPIPGHDLVLLDTKGEEDSDEWCGSFVGTSFIFSDRAAYHPTLEGDPRFFFDGSQTAQGHGTGTEEWAGGGDYWDRRTVTLPFAGHPVGAPYPEQALDSEDLINSAYRFLLSDVFPFGRSARIQLEHGGANEATEHYRTVTYWYGLPGACLIPTDTFHVSNPADEASHDYVSQSRSDPQTITSRFEWGSDSMEGTQIFPATTDSGRFMTTRSEFTMQIHPDNEGVLLRRKLDYARPDQRAEVWISDGATNGPFERVGTWYTAGSNRSLVSYPEGELDPPQLNIRVSNRRWREEELLIAPHFTRGRSSLRIRIEFLPGGGKLFPGDIPPMDQAWSEIRYTAFIWRKPPTP